MNDNYPPGAANDPRAPYNEPMEREIDVTARQVLYKEQTLWTDDEHVLNNDDLTELYHAQHRSALEIIRQQAGHLQVPVVGLAKQFELVFKEGESEPVVLPRHSQALYLIQRIRDEAHRFAITYHRKLRGKRNLVSVLDHIVGIGPKRRQALWNHFGSLARIKEAGVEELAAAPGMNKPAAEAVRNFFLAQQKLLESKGKDNQVGEDS